MKNSFRCKKMWGIVTVVKGKMIKKKAKNYATLLDSWKTGNFKIMGLVGAFGLYIVRRESNFQISF